MSDCTFVVIPKTAVAFEDGKAMEISLVKFFCMTNRLHDFAYNDEDQKRLNRLQGSIERKITWYSKEDRPKYLAHHVDSVKNLEGSSIYEVPSGFRGVVGEYTFDIPCYASVYKIGGTWTIIKDKKEAWKYAIAQNVKNIKNGKLTKWDHDGEVKLTADEYLSMMNEKEESHLEKYGEEIYHHGALNSCSI